MSDTELHSVAGCKIFIGGTKTTKNSDFTESDFSAESWVEIDGWDQMGGIGDQAETLTKSLINRGRDIKQKGTANAGSMENVFADMPGDPGQIALKAAAAPSVKDNYAFKIEYNDAPATGASPAPTKHYFIALAMNKRRAGGGANTFRDINFTLEINSNIVEVAATEDDS